MTYNDLYNKSEQFIKELLKQHLPAGTRVFLFGSRADGTAVKSSDIDIGIESENVIQQDLAKIKNLIEESFVPFNVDLVLFNGQQSEKFTNQAKSKVVIWDID